MSGCCGHDEPTRGQILFGRPNQQTVSVEQDFSRPVSATLRPAGGACQAVIGVEQRTTGGSEAVGRRDLSNRRAALILIFQT
jgi:hypothetical protein